MCYTILLKILSKCSEECSKSEYIQYSFLFLSSWQIMDVTNNNDFSSFEELLVFNISMLYIYWQCIKPILYNNIENFIKMFRKVLEIWVYTIFDFVPVELINYRYC